MWKRTRCASRAGRSRRSPGIWAVTARPSAPICTGERVPGGAPASRRRTRSSRSLEYCRQRLAEDPHLWASTLFDELVGLGYRGLVSVVHPRRCGRGGLRPHCEPCAGLEGPGRARSSTIRPGRRPSGTGWSCPTRPRAGVSGRRRICWSGRWRTRGGGGRCWPSPRTSPHLIEALDRVVRQLGGLTRRWRFDRMATVCYPALGRVTAAFAPVAKHYAVGGAICPPRHGNRKGVVEKANHSAAQRWWRTLADDATVGRAPRPGSTSSAPASATPGPGAGTGRRSPSASSPPPSRCARRRPRPYPAELAVVRDGVGRRRWSPSAATGTRCRPGMPGAQVVVRHRLGADHAARSSPPPARSSRPAPPRPRRRRRDRPRRRARPRAGGRGAGRRSPTRHRAGQDPPPGRRRPRGPKPPGCAATRRAGRPIGRAGRDRHGRLRRRWSRPPPAADQRRDTAGSRAAELSRDRAKPAATSSCAPTWATSSSTTPPRRCTGCSTPPAPTGCR